MMNAARCIVADVLQPDAGAKDSASASGALEPWVAQHAIQYQRWCALY
jgi:hypothetical protein